MSIVVDCVEERPKIYRPNVMYRSMRRTASRTAYNIKKKATDLEKNVRCKTTLHKLNDSVRTPKVEKTPTVRRINRQISRKLADAAEVGRNILKRNTKPQTEVKEHENCYRNTAVILQTPEIGRNKKKVLPYLMATPDSAKMNLLEDKSPSPLSAVVMRAVQERRSKLLAKDRIKILSTPNKGVAPRGRFASPRQLHAEVNALAQGLQDLHHAANNITNKKRQ